MDRANEFPVQASTVTSPERWTIYSKNRPSVSLPPPYFGWPRSLAKIPNNEHAMSYIVASRVVSTLSVASQALLNRPDERHRAFLNQQRQQMPNSTSMTGESLWLWWGPLRYGFHRSGSPLVQRVFKHVLSCRLPSFNGLARRASVDTDCSYHLYIVMMAPFNTKESVLSNANVAASPNGTTSCWQVSLARHDLDKAWKLGMGLRESDPCDGSMPTSNSSNPIKICCWLVRPGTG